MTDPGYPKPSLRQLIHRLQSDEASDEAFRQLFRAYVRPLTYFFANRGFSDSECEDLVQETFLSIHRDIVRLQDPERFESWMFGIAMNLWRNAIRRAAAIKRIGTEISVDTHAHTVSPSVVEPPGALNRLMAAERAERLRRALDSLPPQMRLCVRLRMERGLKYREIAEVTGVALNTVRSQLAQARQRLQDCLSDDFDGWNKDW